MLEVPVPLNLLHTMFSSGVKSLSNQTKENVCVVEKVLPDPISNKSGVRTQIIEKEIENEQEINLPCYILMLDILMKQFELQEVPSHKGLETKEAQLILNLILDILRAPWVGTHTCRDINNIEVSNEEVVQCLYCEMCAIWYQLALSFIEYFCPLMEVTMADVPNQAPNWNVQKKVKEPLKPKLTSDLISIETDFQNVEKISSEINEENNKTNLKTAVVSELEEATDFVDPLSLEPITPVVAKATTITEADVASAVCKVVTVQPLDENEEPITPNELGKGFWQTSQGNFKFTIEELPPQYQLVYELLKEMEAHDDADVLYHLIYCLKLMSLHAETLNKAAKNYRGFLIWCQENLLIKNLWTLLQSEFSQISQMCVPLLLHCITLPSGATMFWKVVEDDFKNDNWRARFVAVERITTIAHFLEPTTVKNSQFLQSALSNAFCYLIHCLDDIEASVSQRALLNLETIKLSSLKLLLWCLEVQFDLVILDRPMILNTIFQLYNHLCERRFLNWDFFLNRFDALFLESQIHLEKFGELSQTRDLKNTNINSEVYQKKLSRAQEAVTHQHAGRSLSVSFGSKLPYKRTISAPLNIVNFRFEPEMHSHTSSRKSSKFAAITGVPHTALPAKLQQHFPNSFFHDHNMKDVAQEETQVLQIIHRAIKLEDQDKETIHLLIFLLMQFFSRPDPSHPQDEKSLTRNQQIVLHHLSLLLGYSPTESSFLITPNHLRTLPVFNSFITSLSKVLDFNIKMGNIILSICLPVLVFCPSPQRYIQDWNHLPLYSLWLLKPHVRQSWLMAVFIIFYKHNYNTPQHLKQIQMILQIVMNTLEAQFHRCKLMHDHLMSPDELKAYDLEPIVLEDDEKAEIDMNIDKIEDEDFIRIKAQFSIDSTEEDEEEEDGEKEERQEEDNNDEQDEEEVDDEKELKEMPQSQKCDLENIKTETKLEIGIHSEQVNEEEREPATTLMREAIFVDETTKLRMSEEVINTCDVVIPIESDKEQEEETKEVIVNLLLENKDFEVVKESQPYHPTIQRLSQQQTSPKSNRPKIQRMEAFEGSLKLKKPKDSEVEQNQEIRIPDESSDKVVSLEESGAMQPQQRTVATKVHRTFSDNAYTTKRQFETATKSTWTIEIHSPIKLRPLMPVKPPQERLLPIGMKDTRNIPTKEFPSESSRGVQTPGHIETLTSGELPFPSCERLLPIGPVPFSRKEHSLLSPSGSTKRLPSHKDVYKEEQSKEEIPVKKLEQQINYVPAQISPPVPDIPTSTRTSEAVAIDMDEIIAKIPEPLKNDDSQPYKMSPKKESKQLIFSPKFVPVLVGTAKVVKTNEPSLKPPEEERPHKTLTETLSQPIPDSITIEELTEKKKPLESSQSFDPNTSIDSSDSIQTPRSGTEEQKAHRQRYKQRRHKKSRNISESQKPAEHIRSGIASTNVSRRYARTSSVVSAPPKKSASNQSFHNVNSVEDLVYERCPNCNGVLEEFSEDELGMCIVILGAYIHREPTLAAPILPDILKLVSRFASLTTFSWQSESNIHLPGNTGSIARQFLRCTLHQLSENGIFKQIFNSCFTGPDFFKSMSLALADFIELNQVSPLVQLFEHLNDRKHLPPMAEMLLMLGNVATYLECITIDSPSQQPWSTFLSQLENFLRKFSLLLPGSGVLNLTPLIRIILSTLKLPIVNTVKTILDPYSKILSHMIQQSPLLYEQLLEICSLCCRNFTRERDRLILTRTVTCELIQAIKFRTLIPDENLMMLVQFVLQDAGGTLVPSVIVENLKMNNTPEFDNFNTNACECVRPNVMDALEFISDVHTLSRVKSNFLGTSIHLNEETLGGHLKAGISQYLALEITKNNGSDHRAITKYLPWLYSLPSLQQGPKEFIDCVAHIRCLSWLLLGSLQHSALLHNNAFLSQPIPLEANTHLAEHIQVILAGFAEQSKASVLHMSSLFHAFILCQLWTMYCENISGQNPPGSDQFHHCTLTLSDFWAKITPGILQLICHSKVLAETVSLHFLSLIEALMECNSTMLARLLPLWTPVFRSYQGQLSGNLAVRLQACINWHPPPQTRDDAAMSTSTLLKWLQRLQTKMSQIEMQSSTAIQFYCI